MPNADLSFGVLSTELFSPAGLGLGMKAYRRFGLRGLNRFVGEMLVSGRDWLTRTFESPARTACSPRGCSTRAWGRTAPRPAS